MYDALNIPVSRVRAQHAPTSQPQAIITQHPRPWKHVQ